MTEIHEGDIKVLNGRVVMVLKTYPIDNIVIAMDMFTHKGSGMAKISDLSECDASVSAFVSLISHAPNMTHEELKNQISMLFGGKK